MNNETFRGCWLTKASIPQSVVVSLLWVPPSNISSPPPPPPPPPALPQIKQWTHGQLWAKNSWHLFDVNLLPSFGKLCLLVLSNFISFTWPWRLFSSFSILLSNSMSASSTPAWLLLGSLNYFSSHSSGTHLLWISRNCICSFLLVTW